MNIGVTDKPHLEWCSEDISHAVHPWAGHETQQPEVLWFKSRVGRGSSGKAPFIHQSTSAEYVKKEGKIWLSDCLSLKEVLQPCLRLRAEDLDNQVKATQGQGSLHHSLLKLYCQEGAQGSLARESVKRGAQFCSAVMRFIQRLTWGANHKATATEPCNTPLPRGLTSKGKMWGLPIPNAAKHPQRKEGTRQRLGGGRRCLCHGGGHCQVTAQDVGSPLLSTTAEGVSPALNPSAKRGPADCFGAGFGSHL